MKIAMIPIDNRPVCYSLPKEIASIDKNLELFLPERKLLGGLGSNADIDGLLKWIGHLPQVDAIVVSLDTIAYGGLISSRRGKEKPEEIRKRLNDFKGKISGKGKVYAFSSIMRISNNNVNEEEKEYWKDYGTKLFEYSYNFHKEGLDSSDVPREIMADYLATRQRNFQINKMYIEWLNEGLFDTLVFSKDDCAEFGLNVLESNVLQNLIDMIDEKKLSSPEKSDFIKSGFIKTGADEIPLALFARAVAGFNNATNATPKIAPQFLAPESKHLISNYEDIAIKDSVKGQIELSGCECLNEADSDTADVILLVNNFEEKQGEIVMGVKTQHFSGQFSLPQKPYLIADVRFANGADNNFIEKLFKKPINWDNFYGYSAWNTSANTLGSLICAGVVRFFAKDYDDAAFKKLQLIRFLDDWAYQANVRQALKGRPQNGKTLNGNSVQKEKRPDVRKLQKLMIPFEKRLSRFIKVESDIKYKFPWKRFFEVEVLIR